MSVLIKIKKLLSLKMLRPAIYTIMGFTVLISTQLALYNILVGSTGLITGNYLIRIRIATFSSIGLSILISTLYFVGYKYPKKSVKRQICSFLSSILILIDVAVWSLVTLIEVSIEGTGSVTIDSTPIFIATFTIFGLNVLKKGYDLIISRS